MIVPDSIRITPLWQVVEQRYMWRYPMYAVIKSGGKQYRVKPGDTIKVEKISAEEGAEVRIDDVLLVADGEDVKVGTPLVSGVSVTATVKSHGRGEKIRVIKFKRRKQYHKQMGHRQAYTELAITGIQTR